MYQRKRRCIKKISSNLKKPGFGRDGLSKLDETEKVREKIKDDGHKENEEVEDMDLGESSGQSELSSPRFEDLFHDPLMQKTAFELFQLMQSPANRFISERSSQRRAMRGDVTTSGRGNQSILPSNDDQCLKEDLPLVSPSTTDEHGYTLVKSLLDRFETSKKKLSKTPKKSQKKIAQYDSSDDEYYLLDNDVENEEEAGRQPDFMECCVPQYELKVKICNAHFNVIRNMKADEIARLCEEILPELIEIRKGNTVSKRHAIFQKCGLSKKKLRDMTVSEPFKQSHEYKVVKLIQDRFSQSHNLIDNNGELIHYISNVLVPEALIRIFAKANGIDIELAEKELRFKGAYDGNVPADVLKTIK